MTKKNLKIFNSLGTGVGFRFLPFLGEDFCFFLKRCLVFLKILPHSFCLHKEDPRNFAGSLLSLGHMNIPVARQKPCKEMSP